MRALARSIRAWRDEGQSVALAFVVSAPPSSLREIGAVMAVSHDGRIAGSVSGGCVEGDVIRTADEVLDSSVPQRRRFRVDADELLDIASPCGGDIEIFVMPYDDEVHGLMLDSFERNESCTISVCMDTENGPFSGVQGVVSDDDQRGAWFEDVVRDEAVDMLESAHAAARGPNPPDRQTFGECKGSYGGTFRLFGEDFFIYRYAARPRLICIGAVHIASCLASMASVAGYETVIVDPRPVFLDQDRFSLVESKKRAWPQDALPQMDIGGDTAICVLTHDAKIDVPALEAALKTNAFYIGCLGSSKTLSSRVQDLKRLGAAPASLARIHGPIGLYIGGHGPEDIAVSILAQVQAVRFGCMGHGGRMSGHTLADFWPEAELCG